MLPSDHLKYLFSIIRPAMWLLGVEYMDSDFGVNLRTIVTSGVMAVSLFSALYTVLYREAEMSFRCLTLLGLTIQGIVRFIVVLQKSSVWRAKYQYFLGVFGQCGGHSREAATLIAWQRPINLVVRLQCGIIIMNVVIFSLTPLVLYLRDGSQTMLLPLMLPGVDERQTNGFLGLTVLQVGGTLAAAGGTLGCDLTIMLLFLCMCMLADLVMLKLRMLAFELLDGGPEVERRPATRAFLHNIIRLHLEFVTQLKSLSDLFAPIFISEISLDSLSMCLILFALKKVTWAPLYLFGMLFFVKTLAACLLGAIISTYVSINLLLL